MMSSFITLKKNSRFKSACPSSGLVTFCEGRPGHVHIRNHRGLTRGFLHQPCASLNSRTESTCPSSGPATFCEGSQPRLRTQSGHVHARSRRVHARSFRCTNLCNFLSASVGIFAAAVRLYSAAPLWVSRHQTLSWTSSASGSLLFGRMHQRPLPLMPRQQPLLLEPQPSHGWSHLLVAPPVPHDEPRNGPFPPGKLNCSLRYRYVDRVEFPTRHDLLEFQNIGVFSPVVQ